MRNDAQKKVDYVIATSRIERQTPSDTAVRLSRSIASGGVSIDSAVEEIKAKYGLNRKH